MIIIRFLLLIIIVNTIQVGAQFLHSEEIVNNKVNNILFNETGEIYSIGSFDVNTRKNGNEYFIEDKNNLLADCFVFSAQESINRTKIIFGIYKNENIIWKSMPFFSGESLINAGDILQIRNLKLNEKVYIIFQMPYIPMGENVGLWVISWDGLNGNVVNEIDDEGYSKLNAIQYSLEVFDVEGDGDNEISGIRTISSIYNEETDEFDLETKEIIYSWNGEIIGDFGVVRPATIPMDRLEAIINANVQKENEIFNYEYQLYNNETSLQSIQNFSISSDIDTIFNGLAPYKWLLINSNLKLILFSIDPYYSDDIDSKIFPGKEENRFKFSSFLLPKIVKYYIQGFNGELSTLNDIKSNSKSGYTIGPVEIVDTLIGANFLDTLISYNSQSFRLGWISDSLTENKYTNYFTTAKVQLHQNNNNAAKTTLQTVLQQVDLDSTNNLTSEA